MEESGNCNLKIASQLQDAAKTDVTQASKGGTVTQFSAPFVSNTLPSALLTSATASATFDNSSFPSLSGGSPLPASIQLPSFASPSSATRPPPPPVGGFVPFTTTSYIAPPQMPQIPIFTPANFPMQEQLTQVQADVAEAKDDGGSLSPSSFRVSAPSSAPGISTEVQIGDASPSGQPALYGPSVGQQSTMFGGWFGGDFMGRVMEKTINSVESVITTLDPGMGQVIKSGGNLRVIVCSSKNVKVEAVREAFQEVFGHATVDGMDSQPNIACQPVGYTAALKGAEDRIEQLRSSSGCSVFVSVESFIAELLPDRWFDVACVLLKDTKNEITIESFSQAVPVEADWVAEAQDRTPVDFSMRWSGLAVTVGEVVSRRLGVPASDWHQHVVGISRKDIVKLAAQACAGQYRKRLSIV